MPATKSNVKKAKSAALKLAKKHVLTEDVKAKIKAIDAALKTGDFDAALEVVAAATAAIKACERKGSKAKATKPAASVDSVTEDLKATSLNGGGSKAPEVPAVETGKLELTIDDVSAEGQQKGLSGADLVKYVLTKMGAGAALIQAEKSSAGKTSTVATGYRTHNCVELRTANNGQQVSLVGWVSKSRVVGQMLAFVDLRDRYGITQCVFQNAEGDAEANALFDKASTLGREYCIRVEGTCRERSAKNPGLPTV